MTQLDRIEGKVDALASAVATMLQVLSSIVDEQDHEQTIDVRTLGDPSAKPLRIDDSAGKVRTL